MSSSKKFRPGNISRISAMKWRFNSLQQYFITIIVFLMLTLSVPLFLSGTLLMNGIIREYAQHLLAAHLNDLIKDVDGRYKTLERIGLEDSIKHIQEIKRISIEKFSAYEFGKTGRIFVVRPDGEMTLSGPLGDLKNDQLLDILHQLQSEQKAKWGFAEFNAQGSSYVSIYTFYPRWNSFIGIAVQKGELFTPAYQFIFINTFTLAVTFLIAILFISHIQNTIIRPMINLAKYADGVSKGHYSLELRGTFRFELRQLKLNLLRMVKNLKKKIDESQIQLEIIQDRERQLKLALNALENEKELLAITLKSIGDGVITTDTDGKIELMNEVAEQLTGWTLQEAYGRPLTEVFNIVDEKTGKPAQDPVRKVIETGMVVGLANHTVLISRDGQHHAIQDSAAPIRDQTGRTFGVVLVFSDVTERRRIEEEQLKIEKLRSVGLLAGGIAHDFNNILAAILGNISLVGLSKDLSPRHRKILQQAEKACMRARGLTQQLLTFARGGDPIKETQSLHEIVIESAEFVLRGSGIQLKIDGGVDLWRVDIDRGQMSQVIQNIVLNAKDAMKDRGTIHIKMENCPDTRPSDTTNHGDWVAVYITDTGPGMTQEVLHQIFEPYFTTKDHGSGLGLSICHSIMKKHDGVILVKSTLGQGTTFSIYLPRATTTQAREAKSDKQVAEPIIQKAKILLIDDDDMVLNTTREMIQYLGHEVHVANNANKAIEKYRTSMEISTPYDCVITDLTMPGEMGGQEIKEEILRLNPKAKIIISSGYAKDPIMAEFEKFGFFGVLIKPYRLIELDNAIRRILNA